MGAGEEKKGAQKETPSLLWEEVGREGGNCKGRGSYYMWKAEGGSRVCATGVGGKERLCRKWPRSGR